MPNCPKCGARLEAVYPLGLKTLWVDFWMCPKCEIAYEPEKLKPIANVIVGWKKHKIDKDTM
jgi:rubredoxin